MVATVEPAELSGFIEAIRPGERVDPKLFVTFVNEGRTTAFINKFTQKSATSDYPKPAKGFAFHVNSEAQAIGPGEDAKFPLGVGLLSDRDVADQFLNGMQVIWFFGYLEYTDFFKYTRRTYFCFDHNMGIGCVTPWGGTKENYMT